MDFEVDLSSLSRDDLEEECIRLQFKCKQLREASEEDAQRIHELKLGLDRATAAENFLSQELEQLTSTTTNNHDLTKSTKLQNENEELRRIHQALNVEFNTLQEDYLSIVQEKKELQHKLKTLTIESESNNADELKADYRKLAERLSAMEQDNVELMQKLEKQRADQIQYTMALAERDKKIELMQDEVVCLEENMRYKRDELDEKSRMLESVQEQLYEANTKISVLISSPDNKERKGNSLFAEVDDQRQAMKHLLVAQKKNYEEMKKIYNESQYEIRRLKRENAAVSKELQACSEIFCSADKTYRDKLNGRIRQLLKHNEELERKLKCTEQNLKDIASERGVPWLDSMLKFCKQETDDLKKQLHSVRIENASLEEELRDLKQEMARWRFESLQSRCLLTDRENLLTENSINFKPRHTQRYRFTENQIQTAAPNIIPPDDKITPESDMVADPSIAQPLQATETKICIDNSVNGNKENGNGGIGHSPIIPKQESLNRKVLQDSQQQTKSSSPQQQSKPIEKLENKTVQSAPAPAPQLQSILSKHRNVFSEDPKKSARFCDEANTIINLPASPNSSVECKEADSKAITTGSGTIIKTMRTKSNVVVRHFIVNSKPK